MYVFDKQYTCTRYIWSSCITFEYIGYTVDILNVNTFMLKYEYTMH